MVTYGLTLAAAAPCRFAATLLSTLNVVLTQALKAMHCVQDPQGTRTAGAIHLWQQRDLMPTCLQGRPWRQDAPDVKMVCKLTFS